MFLMYPSSYPDEGEMLVVVGRSGVQETLATKMVFCAQSIADLTDDDCRELDCLMRQFDDPDEWTGADMCWSFEDGAINVTRLAPSIAMHLSKTDSLLSSPRVEEVRREALEEAAKAIEAKHTNNVGMVHPMAQDDARAIRTLPRSVKDTTK